MTSVAEYLAGRADAPDHIDNGFEESAPTIGGTGEVATDGGGTDSESGRPLCQESGCGRPARKVRNSDDFHPWCSLHNRMHSGEADSAPRSRSPRQLEEKRKAAAKRLEESLMGWGGVIQAQRLVAGDQYCAYMLGTEWPAIARAAADVAQDFPMLRSVLEKGDKYASLSLLILHGGKLLLAMMAHHDLIPYEGPVRYLIPDPRPATATQQPAQPAPAGGMVTPQPEPVTVPV